MTTATSRKAQRPGAAQRLLGLGATVLGLLIPAVTGDGTISLILLPLGLKALLGREKLAA